MIIKHSDIKAMRTDGKSFAAIGRHYSLDRQGTVAMTTAYNKGNDYKPRGGKRKEMTAAILHIAGGSDLYLGLERKLSGLCGSFGMSFESSKFMNACESARNAILGIDADTLAAHPNPLAYAFMRAKGAAMDSLSGYENKHGAGMEALPTWLQE